MVTAQVSPVQSPEKPVKDDEPPAVASRLTPEPDKKLAEQVLPQLMPPGVEATLPVPVPASVTLNVKEGVPHTFGVPAPAQVWGPVQRPHEATVREVPQLSAAVTDPQFFPSREQNVGSLSGTQAHTLVPLQVCGNVHAPHEATVREVPQLSASVREPQFFPSREQNVGSVSGMHAQTFVPLQVCGNVQAPHDATAREAPQLSTSVTEPQFFPSREQNAGSVSGAQTHTLVPLQVCAPEHMPQDVTVREAPQLSAAVTEPQFFPRREQKLVLVSAAQPH